MIFVEEEACRKYDRILELMAEYDLTLKDACIRVGLNHTSFSSLRKRVNKIRKADNGTTYQEV